MESETVQLLRKWHEGDRGALESLLERDLSWIHARVRRRLGPLLRARAETDDFVQDAVAEVLAYTPRFLLSNRAQFRALLAKIVENLLRDQHDHFSAYRRAIHLERPLPSDTRLQLDQPRSPVPRPSEVAERHEWEAWVRLGLEALETEDRRILVKRNWDGLPFAQIAGELGITEDAARMRFHRSLARLASVVNDLRAGKLNGWLGAEPEGEAGD